jgi:hypothetical protein
MLRKTEASGLAAPGLSTQLLRGFHGREGAVQCRQIGKLDVSGLNLLRRELKIFGGTSIPGEEALKPEVRGSADRRIHTHVGHHAGENQLGCVDGTQQVKEARFTEAVRKMLHDRRFAITGTHRGMNLGAHGTRKEEGSAGSLGKVLDVKHRQTELPEALYKRGRLADRSFRTNQLHGSAGEVVVLQVDQDKRSGHGDKGPCEGERTSEAGRCGWDATKGQAAGLWQTASILWPSGPMTNAP